MATKSKKIINSDNTTESSGDDTSSEEREEFVSIFKTVFPALVKAKFKDITDTVLTPTLESNNIEEIKGVLDDLQLWSQRRRDRLLKLMADPLVQHDPEQWRHLTLQYQDLAPLTGKYVDLLCRRIKFLTECEEAVRRYSSSEDSQELLDRSQELNITVQSNTTL